MCSIGTESVQGTPPTSTEIVPICAFFGLFLVRKSYTYLEEPSTQGISGVGVSVGAVVRGEAENTDSVVWAIGVSIAGGTWKCGEIPQLALTVYVDSESGSLWCRGRPSIRWCGGWFQMVPMPPKRLGGRVTRGVLSHFHFQGGYERKAGN